MVLVALVNVASVFKKLVANKFVTLALDAVVEAMVPVANTKVPVEVKLVLKIFTPNILVPVALVNVAKPPKRFGI